MPQTRRTHRQPVLRRRRNRRKPNYYAWILSGLLLILTTEVVYFLLSSPYLAIRSVQVEGARLLTGEKIRNLANIPIGSNIFRVALGKAADRLVQEPLIRQVWIGRSLPDTIAIRITERQPIVTLQTQGRLWEIDAENIPCRRVSRPDPRRPLIVFERPLQVAPGQPIEGEAFKAAMFCADFAARKKLFLMTKIEVDQNGNLCLNMDKGVQVKLGRCFDLPEKLGILELVWRDPRVRYDSVYLDLTCPTKPARLPRSALPSDPQASLSM